MSNANSSTEPTKPMPDPTTKQTTILAFGAHPDDIEFGCGGVIAQATRAGQSAHFVICSRGESASLARRRCGLSNRSEPPRFYGPRSNSSNSMATLIWKSVSPTPSSWRKFCGVCGRSCAGPEPGGKSASRSFPFGPARPRCDAAGPLRRSERAPRPAAARDAAVTVLRPIDGCGTARHFAGFYRCFGTRGHCRLESSDGSARLANQRPRICRIAAHRASERNRAGVGHAIPLFPNDPPVFESLAVFSRGGNRF